MDKLKFFTDIIKAISNPVGKIAFIVSFLIAVGISLFFGTGCAYKFHADSIDNVTQEFTVKGVKK